MQKGKLILIEGTDCSGKQTQAELLAQYLNNIGVKTLGMSFPMYDTPTGKIVGGPYLGKDWLCEGYFKEGASKVDPKVACLYFAADRLYNVDKINKALDEGYTIILDRYVESNMAHQGGKIADIEKRNELIEWIDTLEFKFLKLPKPDYVLFLHMPYECSMKLKENRKEHGDQHENSKDHMINAENTYLYLAKKYNFDTISCVDDKNNIKSIQDISKDVISHVTAKYSIKKD